MATANPKKGLGRGLDALLADNDAETGASRTTVLRTLDIEPNRCLLYTSPSPRD